MLSARTSFAVGLILVASVAGAADVVPWQRDPDAAQQLSAKHGRPLMIYVTTASCPYCRKMEQNTWTDEAIAQRIHERFVPLRLDAERHPDLVRKLRMEGFPTTLIYGPDGKLMGHFAGYAPPARVGATLDHVLTSAK